LIENIQLSLKFTNDQKANYLFSLTEKRIEEIQSSPSPSIVRLYEKHYQYLDRLTAKVENKEEVANRIEENSLRQQFVLADAYNKAPENAKGAILNAQENSSKQVARTIGRVKGAESAQEYLERVEMIQQLEKVGQMELLDRAEMESVPNTDPSQNSPKDLKGTNPLMQGQDLNPIIEGKNGGKNIEPAAPIEMNAPAEQN
jgi:hypothetical protein